MGKKQIQAAPSNKGHKTLREKLRKKRQELKKHKKEKSEKHKLYDSEEQKKKYFQQAAKKTKREDGIKEHRLSKHIERFVDLYEDDVEDFYDLFETLDQGGQIDISGVVDPKMQKCLKKMFKYLPLTKKELEYRKKEGVSTKLRPLMKELVSRSIENYLQNGTDQGQDQENSQKESSQDQNEGEDGKKAKKKKKNKKQKEEVMDKDEQKRKKAIEQNQNLREYEKLQLYPERIVQEEIQVNPGVLGPFISAEQRQMLAKMVEQQSKLEEEAQKEKLNEQDGEFQRIFSMSTENQTKKVKAQSKAKPCIDDIPQQLLAEGSARIGQKQEIDPQEIQEYNKAFRPRKLVEEHQEMRKLGKYAETDGDGKKKRVPFDRERDIVNGRSRQFMNNGVFFDFKERMTKPKSSNNFL